MLGISTCFFARKKLSGEKILQETENLGLEALELEYRLSREKFYEIKKGLKKYPLRVISLHNYCYRPRNISLEEADADYYRLSSFNELERKRAVSLTQKTIENAAEIGAKFVVLHLGDTGQPKERNFFRSLDNLQKRSTSQAKKKIDDYLKTRARLAEKFINQIKKSLDPLLNLALRYKLKICLENRYYSHQYPNFFELKELLSFYNDKTLGFWLDTGHAYVQKLWGWPDLADYLDTFSDRLYGCHLHDSVGSLDHQPPGKGEVNFNFLKKFKTNLPIILEIKSFHSTQDLKAGINLIQNILK